MTLSSSGSSVLPVGLCAYEGSVSFSKLSLMLQQMALQNFLREAQFDRRVEIVMS